MYRLNHMQQKIVASFDVIDGTLTYFRKKSTVSDICSPLDVGI